MNFKLKCGNWVKLIEDTLAGFMQKAAQKAEDEKSIYEAMSYSLMAGGKRLRPMLALATCEMLEGDINHVLPYACAIEMIHTYSLIHDDLPSMDNDNYRRGRLTNHKVYGEATAILAGDALLNYAFEIMLDHAMDSDKNMGSKVKAMGIVAKASGASGMIGGQVVDLESEGKNISLELLRYMHSLKTGALIKAPVMASGVLCGASGEKLELLRLYAERLGLAFQIKDDILDVEGDFSLLGKQTGSDEAKCKSTFIKLLGLEESKKRLASITDEAVHALDYFEGKGVFLQRLARQLLERKN